MRLNQAPTLRIQGRYFNDQIMYRELSNVLGTKVTNADALYDVLTDPFEFVEYLRIVWRLPHSPLTVPERALLGVLLDVSDTRDDLSMEFPNPPRWFSASDNLSW